MRAIAPRGAIYLSVQFDLVGAQPFGRTITTNEDIRQLLLERAGLRRRAVPGLRRRATTPAGSGSRSARSRSPRSRPRCRGSRPRCAPDGARRDRRRSPPGGIMNARVPFRRASVALAAIAALAVPGGALLEARPAYPPTPVRAVADTLHGRTLSDPYRWLEDGAAAEVEAWTDAQDGFTRSVLAPSPAAARSPPRTSSCSPSTRSSRRARRGRGCSSSARRACATSRRSTSSKEAGAGRGRRSTPTVSRPTARSRSTGGTRVPTARTSPTASPRAEAR